MSDLRPQVTTPDDGWCVSLDHAHFHRRLLERYGIVLEFGEFSRILRVVRNRYARFIGYREGGLATWGVRLPGRSVLLFVVATRGGGSVVTVLPPDAYREVKGRLVRNPARAWTSPSTHPTLAAEAGA